MRQRVEYPLWETDQVTLQISPTHFFSIELRDRPACVLSVSEITRDKGILTFRNYVDEAMMQPEHFRMVVDFFLKDSTKKGILHERWLESNISDQAVEVKTILEQRKMERNCVGNLHCGSVLVHAPHFHLEDRKAHYCTGWTNE